MSTIAKSSHNLTADPVVDYCAKHTIKQQPIQKELFESSMQKIPGGRMLGAPEVHTLGETLIHLINGKKILDIGTLSGASALAWALAAGEGGKVYTLDITFDKYNEIGVPIVSKDEDIFSRIITVEGPALESLDRFITEGQSGTFDFAFIDADKVVRMYVF
ncbi:O-methyltransferase [Oesophagostomum dentatum]|uniref:O-methyltransferase n=1 Tax=Oesophagostomum dentatum TaxID=61180 RepID=A0A0B1S2X1_OESDE|nr:O-methyltransferase [Oesophagostomum dentatum]